MYTTLSFPRRASSKSISYAIWHPDLARASLVLARGVVLEGVGHSVARPLGGQVGKTYKRLELLPEEAIWLIERGSLFCWRELDLQDVKASGLGNAPGLENVLGAPMSVQQAYTAILGTAGLTMERFQVYAYLKRLGYNVTRARAPDGMYPRAAGADILDAAGGGVEKGAHSSVALGLPTSTSTSFAWLFQPLGFVRSLAHVLRGSLTSLFRPLTSLLRPLTTFLRPLLRPSSIERDWWRPAVHALAPRERGYREFLLYVSFFHRSFLSHWRSVCYCFLAARL